MIAKYQCCFPVFDESEEDQKTVQRTVFPTDHLHVRHRHEHAEDPKAREGALQH